MVLVKQKNRVDSQRTAQDSWVKVSNSGCKVEIKSMFCDIRHSTQACQIRDSSPTRNNWTGQLLQTRFQAEWGSKCVLSVRLKCESFISKQLKQAKAWQVLLNIEDMRWNSTQIYRNSCRFNELQLSGRDNSWDFELAI